RRRRGCPLRRRPPGARGSFLVPAALVALPLLLVLRRKDEEFRLDRQRVPAPGEEQGGGRVDSGGEALALLLLDHRVEPAGIDLFQHLAAVEADLPRVRLELIVAELVLVDAEPPAHPPSLAHLPARP